MAYAGRWGTAVMVVAATVAVCPTADASFDQYALNGTFIATSNGEWAKTNDVFHDEDSVRGTWTVSSTCVTPSDCAGSVSSDWGWTAPIYMKNGMWYVKRPVPGWMPCPDGTFVDGHQTYRFSPVDPNGSYQRVSNMFVGQDSTEGPSGACGKNLPLEIKMPFKLVRA